MNPNSQKYKLSLLIAIIFVALAGCRLDDNQIRGTIAGGSGGGNPPPELVVGTISVAEVYSSNSNWSQYVRNNGTTVYDADNTACDGTENTNYDDCIHGAEIRKVEAPILSSCGAHSARDELGVFTWVCDDSGSPVTFYSTEVKYNKGLKDLVADTSSFYQNSVIINDGTYDILQTNDGTWWSNTLAALPTGTNPLDTAGTIYVLDSSRTDGEHAITADRVAVVTINGAILGSSAGNSLTITSRQFVWVEADISGAPAYGVYAGATTHSQFRNSNLLTNTNSSLLLNTGCNYNRVIHVGANGATGASTSGIRLDSAHYNLIHRSTANSNTGDGLFLVSSTNNKLVDSTFENNAQDGIDTWSDSDNNIAENLTFSGNGSYALKLTNNASGWLIDGVTVTSGGGPTLSSTATQNILKNVNVNCGGAASSTGISVSGATYNQFYNTQITGCTASGMYIYGGAQFNRIFNYKAYNNSVGGGVLTIEGNNTDFNTFVNILTTSSSAVGIRMLTGPSYNTLSHITTVNNVTHGIFLSNGAEFNTLSHLTSSNNGVGVRLASSSNSNLLHQIVAVNNTNEGIVLDSESNNTFHDNLLVDSNGGSNCSVVASTVPGLTFACANQNGSAANYVAGSDLSSSFLGKVTSDDSANSSDSNGSLVFDSLTDWLNFDTFFRTWGIDNVAVFPDALHQGDCATTETCRIWDWRLASTDTEILNTSNDGATANAAFVAGSACPAAVDGDYTIEDQQTATYYAGINAIEVLADAIGNDDGVCEAAEECFNRYLVNATEIIDDSIGDDDGLCESGESCIYSPNFGAYQGQGDYASGGTCTFNDGSGGAPVTGVSMYAYPTNGS